MYTRQHLRRQRRARTGNKDQIRESSNQYRLEDSFFLEQATENEIMKTKLTTMQLTTAIVCMLCIGSFAGLAATPAPKKTPTRVVCLAPSYTETMVALNLQSRIVGITTSSDHVEACKDVERVGLFMRPNLEKIISLRPDLVFASMYSGQRALIEKLRSLKIKVVILETNEIDDIFDTVSLMGKLFDHMEQAAQLNKQMRTIVDDVKERTKDVPRPRIYIEAGSDPLFSCGKGSFIHELLELAGSENIAGDMNTPYPRVSSELVISRDPEIILLPYMAGTAVRATVRSRSGWHVITAIKNNRILDDLGSQTITIPSPRLILEGLPELFKRIHPELVKPDNLKTTNNTKQEEGK